MKLTFAIRDWDINFENHESRKLRVTRWVPVPNKHDGKTFSRIASHPRAVEIWCAWSLIIEVASKMPTRGVLYDSDGPLDAEDLASKTRFPPAIFEVALETLAEPKYGWIESYEGPPKVDDPAPPPPTPPAPRVRHGQTMLIDTGDLPFDSHDFKVEWADYLALRKEKKSKLTPTSQKRLFRQFVEWGEARTIAAMRWSIPKGWLGIFEPHLPGASVVQKPMFTATPESPEAADLRKNCKRCGGTSTEIIPNVGARPCDHLAEEDV